MISSLASSLCNASFSFSFVLEALSPFSSSCSYDGTRGGYTRMYSSDESVVARYTAQRKRFKCAEARVASSQSLVTVSVYPEVLLRCCTDFSACIQIQVFQTLHAKTAVFTKLCMPRCSSCAHRRSYRFKLNARDARVQQHT